MKKLLLIVLIISISITIVSCKRAYNPNSPDSTTEQATIESEPSTDGKVDRNLMTATAKQYGITHENYPSKASKTVPSYKRLINGEVDLILVPYASQDVLNLAKKSDVELEFILS